MKIISIDPSLANIGVACLMDAELLNSYTFKTKPSDPLPQRLKEIYQHFRGLKGKYDYALIEMPDTFMRMGDYGIKNVRDIQMLMLSIGVITASLIRYKTEFVTVKEWKGKTEKRITQMIAKQECGKKMNEHEADAFVMALRWRRIIRFKRMVRKKGGRYGN